MTTIVNNFDAFVKAIQNIKKDTKYAYEATLDSSQVSFDSVLLHARYVAFKDILSLASSYTEDNVKFE